MTALSEPDELDALTRDGAESIDATCRFLGLSRASLYRAMAAGEIRYTKRGRRTLILRASARAYLAAGIGRPLEPAPRANTPERKAGGPG